MLDLFSHRKSVLFVALTIGSVGCGDIEQQNCTMAGACLPGFHIDNQTCSCIPDNCECPRNYDPVCGAGEVEYANACIADCSGAVIIYQGRCQGPDHNACSIPTTGTLIAGAEAIVQPEASCLQPDALIQPDSQALPRAIVSSAEGWRALFKTECDYATNDTVADLVGFGQRNLVVIQVFNAASPSFNWAADLDGSLGIGIFLPLSGAGPPEEGVLVGVAIPKSGYEGDANTVQVTTCGEQLCDGCDPPP